MTTLGTPGLLVAARVKLSFPDAAAAERALVALRPESEGFLSLAVDGERLVLTTEAASVGRTLATVDDAVGSLQAALGATDQTE